MNKKLIQKNKTIKTLAGMLFCLAIAVTLHVAYAEFNAPSTLPPLNNLDTPITVLQTAQIKGGDLSVGAFSAWGAAQFDQQVFFKGSIKGEKADPTDATGITGIDAPLQIGGSTQTNAYYVAATVSGVVKSGKTLGAAELTSPSGKNMPLCADDEGHIVLCHEITYILASGDVSSAPVQGGTNDTNAVCSASLSNPAPVGGAIVHMRYQTNLDNTGQQQCEVDIPEGSISGTDYPGKEYFGAGSNNLQITNSCYIDGGVGTSNIPLPNDTNSGIPNC